MYRIKKVKYVWKKTKTVKWWLPGDGRWGDKIDGVYGYKLEQVQNKPLRSNAQYDEYRQ